MRAGSSQNSGSVVTHAHRKDTMIAGPRARARGDVVVTCARAPERAAGETDEFAALAREIGAVARLDGRCRGAVAADGRRERDVDGEGPHVADGHPRDDAEAG